ncbi:TonB-dependent receptor [Flavobacterium azooxidireducens]|uniref:TonB-dependent receptor n=1 Tax=Flavobacterium azooxidireducens TaxID=1871076 RepID=A0ABY4KIX6_9FLAO|nr:TonB-dependent receptor [Flavobacterium azooxidireducens]UPQ79628.1 TonB-dependent receptor [Flavobacterium azooxidireducens]
MKKLVHILSLFMIIWNVSAQSGTISGTIKNNQNQPLENVNVVLKGTTIGTRTNLEGQFTLNNIQNGNHTVSISHIGFASKEITINLANFNDLGILILQENNQALEEIVLNGKVNKYRREESTVVSKMPLKDIENPQVYNAIPSELLKEQVVTNFNDALKNATGVTRLWESTGRNGDGAEFYSMRGFAVQPTMTNGLPSLTNTTIDPINVDNIEVIKGPSGTLFGSSVISYGGLINVVTKKPYEQFGGEISYINGTYGSNRLTADINIPLKDKIAIRVNSAYTTEESFQDAGFSNAFFIAPSLKYEVSDKLTFLVNTEFYKNTSAKASMIFLSRYAPLSFDNMSLFEQNYKKSFTSNDLTMNNNSFNMQMQALYKLSENWTSQTVLSKSTTKTNGYYQYLWDSANGDEFTRFISKADGTFYTTDIQQNFIGDFKIGKMRNRLVAGLDYYNSRLINGGAGWIGYGTVSLVNGTDTNGVDLNGDPLQTVLTQPGVDNALAGSFGGNTEANQEVISAYVSDVLNITEKLSVMASLRLDYFDGKTSQYDAEETKSQVAISPKFGAVYQLIENKVSVFGNYMNGFQNVAPITVADLDGSNPRTKEFDPEQANQYELGLKTSLYKDVISASISYYNIQVKDRVITDPNNINNSIQGGEVESKGIEISLVANPIKGLNIITGFSKNNAEVTKETPGDGYLGLRPEEAGPETLVNFWANYMITSGQLKGFGIGFGGNYASEYKTLNRANIGTFELPSYTVLNSALSYDNSKFNVSLKLNNLLNEKYYSGWSTVTPQRLRSITAGVTYKF